MASNLSLLFLVTPLLTAQRTIRVPVDAPTIQAGIVAAADGDTVLVSPGTYVENLDLLGKSITVTSGAANYTEAANTVVRAAHTGVVVSMVHGETERTIFNGFTVTGATYPEHGPSPRRSGGILVIGSAPSITNNVIHDNIGCGIAVQDGGSPSIRGNHLYADFTYSIDGSGVGSCVTATGAGGGGDISLTNAGNVEIIGNWVEDSRTAATHNTHGSLGIQQSSHVLVANNRFTAASSITGGGVFFTPASGPQMYVAFVQNTLENFIGIQIEGNSIYETPWATYLIVNNSIGSGSLGFRGYYAATAIRNNVVRGSHSPYYPQPDSLSCVQTYTTSDLNLQNDDFFLPQPLTPILGYHACPYSGGVLEADPLFRDLANGDLHETDASPTIYAGDINAPLLPATDLDGKNRTVCGKVDMGAYQRHPRPPIAVAATPNPVAGGSAVTFTATLTGNCNVPTGTVTFYDNGTAVGTGMLNGAAVATFSTAFLVVGQHHITATYPGDFNFEEGASDGVGLTVTGLPTATTLAVAPNPARPNQPVTLVATVTDPYQPVSGTVTFSAGGLVLGTAPVVNGVATVTTTQLTAGSYAVDALFNATTQFAASSATVQLVVQGAVSTTSLTSSLNPSIVGQAVTLTAVVALSGTPTAPEGTVTFRDGAVALGTATLAGGRAVLAVSTLAAGTHSITAAYSGSALVSASASPVLVEVVGPVTYALQLSAAPNPAHAGETVSLRLSVTANDGHAVGGSATFAEGATVLGSAPLLNGTGALPVGTLAVGQHTIVATYTDPVSGSATVASPVQVVITPFDFSLNSSATDLNIPRSGFAEVTLTLAALGGYDRALQLRCGLLPANAQCFFDREWTQPLSQGPQTVHLLVNADALYRYGPPGTRASLQLWRVSGPALACVFLLVRRRYRGGRLLALVLLLLAPVVQGCGGKEPAATAPGDYSFTVTAQSSAGESHSLALQMHVR